MSATPKKNTIMGRKKWAIGFGIFFLLYTIGGFWIAPVVIKSQATKIIKTQTGLTAEFGKIKVNPYVLSLTLEEFSVSPEGEPDWISLGRMYANAQISSLFRSDYMVKEVRVDGAELLIEWKDNGRINWLTVLDNLPRSTSAEPFEIPGLRIGQLSISNAAVRWQDRFLAKEFESTVDDVDLVLTNFHTLGTNELFFGATLDDETDINAQGTFSIEPVTAKIHSEVDALLLERYADYIPEWSPLKLTGGQVNTSIDAAAEFNGGTLSVTISNGNVSIAELALVTAEDELEVFVIDDVSVSGAGADLQSLSADIEKVSVAGVLLEANRLQDGSIDWIQRLDAVMANFPSSTNAASKDPLDIPSIQINQISISNTAVRWQDRSLAENFESAIEDIELVLTNFHSLGTNSFEFGATLDGDTKITSDGVFLIEPITAKVHSEVDALLLERYAAYIPEWSPLSITGGRVATSIDASASFSDGAFQATVSDGSVNVAELALITPEDDEEVLNLNQVALEGVAAGLADRSANVDTLKIDGVSISASRDVEGMIDWHERIQRILDNLVVPSLDDSEKTKPWNWVLKKFNVQNANLAITDRMVSTPVEVKVKNASATIQDLSPSFEKPLPIKLGFELESGGSGEISGTVTPVPLSAELNVLVNNLFFPIGQPYIHDILRLQLKKGTVSLDGITKISLVETNALRASYLGDISLDNVVVHENSDLPFATVRSVRVDDLEADWPLDDFKVNSVIVDAPSVDLYIREDGTVNVEEMVPAYITEQIYHQLNKAWQLLQFEVNQALVTNGFIHFEDLSITPNMTGQVTNLFVKLDGLSPESTEPATLNAGGMVKPKGPFTVVADFVPASTNLSANIVIEAQMVSLSPASPYSGKILGYLIDSGNVSLDLHYGIKDELVNGQNRVIVEEFEFGQKTESEEAVRLPVKLGVTLLKDRKGTIDLNVPIEGDLRDPEFKLGDVIWSAFANIFREAAKAPFKFLGNLVGAGDDGDLGSLEFAAGQSELRDEEKKKAMKLSQALTKRPQLRLEIVGRYDPSADAEQLRDELLEKKLTDLKSQINNDDELRKLSRTFQNPDALDQDDLVQLLYVKTFGVNYSVPTKPPPDLIARRALEDWTSNRAEEESFFLSTNQAPATAGSSFWSKTKNVITLKPLTQSKTENTEENTEPAATTPESSNTARIITIDEPIPVLPTLPSVVEMAEELKKKLPVDASDLTELANARAEAVRDFFVVEASIDESRLKVTNELTGAELATDDSKVFLGIY